MGLELCVDARNLCVLPLGGRDARTEVFADGVLLVAEAAVFGPNCRRAALEGSHLI